MSALATTPDDLKQMIQQIIDDERDSLTPRQIFMVLLDLVQSNPPLPDEDKP